MIEIALFLSTLNRKHKVALQLVFDCILVVGCFLAAMFIRLEETAFLSNHKIWLPLAASTVAALSMLWASGLYTSLVRFVTGKVLPAILKGVVAFAVMLFLTNLVLSAGIPRSVPFISALLIFVSIGAARFAARSALRFPSERDKKRVIIFGAGHAGLELLNSLFHGKDYLPVAFVDDDLRLKGLKMGGCRVYPPSEIERLREIYGVEAILLAMPSITRKRRQEILDDLEDYRLEVKTVPAISDVLSGKAKIAELRNVSTEDLLGRDPVTPNQTLLSRNISGKVVMITGAGGSIGSELCRQALGLKPSKLILFELSEYALYSIEAELRGTAEKEAIGTEIHPILGSVQDSIRVEEVIATFGVQTIYHAAAYKHVPIVEENITQGVRNNVFGTFCVAEAAAKHEIENFILISTDKAVRPTNIMGATKRLAELICQGLAQQVDSGTRFSMVRFGNVLGSSGSVIPRFRAQIEAGGPVTVTHPEINRYFMTIPEAAALVIQAGAMAKGGDVFVLDMGEAVKIVDLAEAIIKLHGLKPYFVERIDEAFPELGDIPICFTGLRKGEKLYEELLIGNDPQPTLHPRIMTASEASLSPEELARSINSLRRACDVGDVSAICSLLISLPLDYSPSSDEIGDIVWKKKMKDGSTFEVDEAAVS